MAGAASADARTWRRVNMEFSPLRRFLIGYPGSGVERMLAGVRPKILSSDSSRLRARASPVIAAAHTEPVAEESDNNTTDPGRDLFRAKAEKRLSRVRYTAKGQVTTGGNRSSGGKRQKRRFQQRPPSKRTIDP